MAAGWFPDPTDPRWLRYWDGTVWTEHTAPNAPMPGRGPTPPKQRSRHLVRWIAVAVAVAFAVAFAVAVGVQVVQDESSTKVDVVSLGLIEEYPPPFLSTLDNEVHDAAASARPTGAYCEEANGTLVDIRAKDNGWPDSIRVPYDKLMADYGRAVDACRKLRYTEARQAFDDSRTDLRAVLDAIKKHCKPTSDGANDSCD